MARDGTNRGGARIGAGRKRKSLEDKILEGQALKPEKNQTQFKAPTPKDYLSQQQRDGTALAARQIYRDTYHWLAKCGCADTINQQLIECYAETTARHIQAESELSRAGLIVRHPMTSEVLPSPLVKISLDYLKAAQQIWYQIDRHVKENSTGNSGGIGTTDTMELILRRTERR